jgi:hypothetical protein
MQVFEGGCLCGAVRYRATGAARSSSVCFCRSCRLASGAPSVAWVVFDIGGFSLLRGSFTTFKSSPAVTWSFCASCGTSLAYQNDDDRSVIELTTASLDEPTLLAPSREIWHSHRLSWAASDPKLPHCPRGSADGGDEGDQP